MQIVNRTRFHVDFFVRSTTTGTMVSKGWLEPGEADEWEAPHYHHAGCNVQFRDHEGNTWDVDADASGTVVLREADGQVAVDAG